MINELVKKWEEGFSIVVGVKNKSEENPLMFAIRKIYYNLIKKFSDVEQIKNFTGFGLYDQKFISVLRDLHDPYPYFRGLVTELGWNRAEISAAVSLSLLVAGLGGPLAGRLVDRWSARGLIMVGAAIYLASDAASFTTGAIIAIDGGSMT